MDGLNLLRRSKTHQEQAPLLYNLLNEKLSAHLALYDAEVAARVCICYILLYLRILRPTLHIFQSPWVELDFEHEASAAAPLSGLLGCNEKSSFLENDPSWHGGKVHFHCKLTKPPEQNTLKLTLEKPYLGPSSRMTRRFGSDRFIRVKIASNIFYSEGTKLVSYFQQPFIFNNRVYRAFFAKDSTVFLVQTAEKLDRDETGNALTISPASVPGVLSLLEFLHWHNPLELNLSQVCFSF